MRLLDYDEQKEALKWLSWANSIAWNSPCYRSKCGSVIVRNKKVIGAGFNSPPTGTTLEHCFKDELPQNFKSDRTCCVHAEQRAIMDAVNKSHEKIFESRIYFVRQGENRDIKKSGKPYCTICSKMALDVGISEWVLWHDKGIYVYDTHEYNEISFGHKKWLL